MNDIWGRQERERVAALHTYQALDTPPEPCFDRLTRTAARALQAPIAILTLVDEERAFAKSAFGMSIGDIPRDHMFYRANRDRHQLFVIPDTTLDERFVSNPYVVGGPHFRFYAGAPLITPAGYYIGTLSVFDIKPRSPSQEDLAILEDLAAEAMEQIEHRLDRIKLEHYAAALQQKQLEFRQALERSEKSEARASLALEAGDMGYWEWDASAGRTVWSPRTECIFGFEPGTYDGSFDSWVACLHPDDRDRIQQEFTRCCENRSPLVLRYRIVRAGGLRWVCQKGAFELDENQQIRGAYGICWDGTEREKWLAELKASEESFRNLSVACPVGIFKGSLDGQITYVNPRAAAIWAMADADTHGFSWLERVHPEDRQPLISGCVAANNAGSPFEQEFRLRMPDGSIRWIHGQSAVIDGPDGGMVVGTVHDVTSRKEADMALQAAKAEAESANRAKDLFLANISHELRTPLNGILGTSELLLQSHLETTQRECAEMIQKAGKTLLSLVNDILDEGKIRAGTLSIESAPFDIRLLVETAANYVRSEAHKKGLEIAVACSGEVPPRLIGDGNRVQQIVLNFLTNAVKFTDSGGIRCLAQCERSGPNRRTVLIEVRDSGDGIPSEAQSKLFQPFSRLDNSTTRKQQGMGLGLSICRKLAELMGGSVGVNSVPGSGSTFWLKLELPVPEEAAAPEEVHSVAEPEPAQEQRGRILVAEDNQINQRVVSRMLERLGWDVDIAPDGVKAHALASKNRYAMVLMDCLMPEADGYTATAMIREHERQHGLPRLPIVALTANALSGDRERCLQAGMDDYLSKPLQLHLLKEVLQRWASASEVTAEL